MSLDFTKPVQTKDGRKVRILATDINSSLFPVVGVIDEVTYEALRRYTLDGKCDSLYSIDDLVQVPDYLWINIYKNGGATVHQTKENAVKMGFIDTVIARIKVPRIEGKFDE